MSMTLFFNHLLNFSTLLCLIVGGGGGSNCKFWEKNPQTYLIIIRE